MLIVNLSQDSSKQNKYLSTTLLSHITTNLKKWLKTILYLNKRGNFESLICTNCNKIYHCKNCDTSLSIHGQSMICHICGYSQKVPWKCDTCKSNKLLKVWVGTKQIQESLESLFPKAKIFRLDTDVVKNKSEKTAALNNLDSAEIIIGTKMITTGFDFEDIGLIAVLLLEQELQFPSYRAEELLYSNIKQLIGRWGRKGQKTDFIIQTYTPDNPFVKMLAESNTKDFLIHTLKERKLFNYPPFSEFTTLEYRHKTLEKAQSYIQKLYQTLQELNSENKYEIHLNSNYFKKYNQYYFKIVIKGKDIRDFLQPIKKKIFSEKNLVVIFN